jgi:UDP-glucose 4-epimerase
MKHSFNNRSVLVTGGAGFIGSHLVELLLRYGADVVTVVDSLSTGRLSNIESVRSRITIEKLDLVKADLRPLLKTTSFDTVFHLAGNAHVNQSVDHPDMDMEKNILGTFRMLEAIRDISPESRIVFTSSATVYGEAAHAPIKEDDPKIPESPYGVSKLACEHYLRLFAKLYGLRTSIARLFSVYGPRLRKQVVYDLMCKLHRDPNKLFLHGDGTQVRDLNHVSNVTDALLLIAQKARLEGEDYNVAMGEPVSIREIAEQVSNAMGMDPQFEFSGEVRPGEIQKWFPDASRLFSLGYRTRVSLREGLRDTANWFLTEEAGTLGNNNGNLR